MDRLFPGFFCLLVPFFCIRRVLPQENKLIMDVWFKQNNTAVHGQVWRQDGVCPTLLAAVLPPAPTPLGGGARPRPLRCWRSSLDAQDRMWVMRHGRSIWGNPRAFCSGCVLPSLRITDVASSPRFLKSFGSPRLHHTGVGSPCARFAAC